MLLDLIYIELYLIAIIDSNGSEDERSCPQRKRLRPRCAIDTLNTGTGIRYTAHMIHASYNGPCGSNLLYYFLDL